jgi:hypothetical protein
MSHCMRKTVISLRLADLIGVSDDDREATYYLGLMMNAYCHADATEQARWFGDDIGLKADGQGRGPQDRLEPHRAHLHQAGSHEPRCGHPLRHAAGLRRQLPVLVARSAVGRRVRRPSGKAQNQACNGLGVWLFVLVIHQPAVAVALVLAEDSSHDEQVVLRV